MGKYAKSYFENPYLDEQSKDNKYSAEVIMDEARQKWRVGSWRARSTAFELERKQLAEGGESEDKPAARPPAARFRLDVRRDLTGETISLKTLRELDYSPSYRPKGDLEERMVGQRSTLQRYDILAGELEAPPEDLSFVSDAEARRERDERSGTRRSGALRRSSRRLDTSVEERRSALIRMLPDTDKSAAKSIVADARRRKQREDAELGKTKKRRNYTYRAENAAEKDKNSDEAFARRLAASRLDRLPEQTGMTENSIELPEFTTEARYWSQIPVDNPSWSEIAAHSVYTVPQDEDDSRVDPRFIRQENPDERSEYGYTATRARLKSDEAGEFKNEYIRDANIDPERVKQIMERRYRGRWIPPEFFADDRLVEDYFHALSAGQTRGEDFVTWAYNRKLAEQQQMEMQEQARRQYARAIRAQEAARRRAQHARPDNRAEAKRRYEEARRRGYQHGAEMSRSRQNKPAAPPMMPPAMYPPQMPMPPMMPPTVQPYGYNPYGGYVPAQPVGKPGYQGQYPELFEGRNTRPMYNPPPMPPQKPGEE